MRQSLCLLNAISSQSWHFFPLISGNYYLIILTCWQDVWYRELFVSAALAMVFFTVFLQGATIKLLVKLLDIQLSKAKDKNLAADIQASVTYMYL